MSAPGDASGAGASADPFPLLQTGLTASRPASFKPTHLKKVLIANRGEIALRLIRACKALGIATVSIYSSEDAGAPHVRAADEAVAISGRESATDAPGGYLGRDAIVAAARSTGAQAVLPGYGFLSENAGMARACDDAGILWCGPTAQTIADFGSKHEARALAVKAGVPVVPGSGLLKDADAAAAEAQRIGFPIILKASSGGGGMGLQVCHDASSLKKAYDTVCSRSQALYGDTKVFIEKYIGDGRHIEVQIFGNGQGDVVHFGERECSIQRRHQKVVEECPSPYVEARTQAGDDLRRRLTTAAVDLGKVAHYRSAGTVEFIVSDATGEFYYLESNCRLQVEHPVTEQVWDVDLVALMLRQADAQLAGAGGIPRDELLALQRDAPPAGATARHAIEVRLYAEDPIRDYMPSPGLLQNVAWPAADARFAKQIRLDSWVRTGTAVSPSYDPLLAKVIAHSPTDRADAAAVLHAFLAQAHVQGAPTNLRFLADVVHNDAFLRGQTLTSFLEDARVFTYKPRAIEVLAPGLGTSVQDAGRRGVGHGVPESGAMDRLHMRIANALLGTGQHADTEVLEMTLIGPHLRFHAHALVAVAGDVEVELVESGSSGSGSGRQPYSRFAVPAGAVLKLGKVRTGCRAYLAIQGGLPSVAEWLGSKATTAVLGVGGYQGRNLAAGDTLEIVPTDAQQASIFELPQQLWPSNAVGEPCTLFCMRGPYDTPDYVTDSDLKKLYGHAWTVSAQSARTGLRLEGALLEWARKDGGEGGAHPSNVLEIPYPPLGINWNGDTPVILGVDAPDLGGLLITHTIIQDEWRIGQLKAGDKLVFKPVTFEQAREVSKRSAAFVEEVASAAKSGSAGSLKPLSMQLDDEDAGLKTSPILVDIPANGPERSSTVIRASGDRCISLEVGEMRIDLTNRCRIELLDRAIAEKRAQHPGLGITNANLRSTSIIFDPAKMSQREVADLLQQLDASLPAANNVKIRTRQYTLPVVFDDPGTKLAEQRYQDLVRNKAVYVPSNKEYLRKANGLASTDDVENAVLAGPMLVWSVGFYAATPIASAVNPLHRIVSQKLNPTRSWTAGGALGFGGSCAAIYGMDSPGGYQLLGATIPSWDTFVTKPGFRAPWLLENFDTLVFKRVEQEEYDRLLLQFKCGTYQFDVQETDFDVAKAVARERADAEKIAAYQQKQRAALAEISEEEAKLFAEWSKEQQEAKASGSASTANLAALTSDPNNIIATASLNSNVWKIYVKDGDTVEPGQRLATNEAMKTEVDIFAPEGMRKVIAVVVKPGDSVKSGDALIVGRAE